VKRLLDVAIATAGLLMLWPVLTAIAAVVWVHDFQSPLYLALRVGKHGNFFRMVKFRSMIVDADRFGVSSTSQDDSRVTTVGRFLRAFKLDELPQLWNVFVGEMSLVGPRPQVPKDVEIYTDVERELLLVRPGMTDLSSIVFSDEAEILKGRPDPDAVYNHLIRPWKSRLGLLYVAHRSLRLDLRIILITGLSAISRRAALNGVQNVLQTIDADALVRHVARREQALEPYSPPGVS